jgi:hypothetical protein
MALFFAGRPRRVELQYQIVAADPLLRIPHLYHFTDVSNMPNIRELEGLYSTAKLREMGIEFCSGGDADSLSLDIGCGMDQFLHLCFDLRHPMAGRVKERRPDANLFYLKIDRAILYQPGVLFATGVGYASGVNTVPVADAAAQGLIDFQVLYTFMPWGDPQVQQRRRAAELCEVLVPDYVAMKFIRNLPNG